MVWSIGSSAVLVAWPFRLASLVTGSIGLAAYWLVVLARPIGLLGFVARSIGLTYWLDLLDLGVWFGLYRLGSLAWLV